MANVLIFYFVVDYNIFTKYVTARIHIICLSCLYKLATPQIVFIDQQIVRINI